MTTAPVLTIDGPSGSGKGTISRQVAGRLGWHLLDSGALYRLVALAGLRARLAPDDEAAHARLAAAMQVRFGTAPDGGEQILLGEPAEEVTSAIRSEEAGQGASRVAVWGQVRAALLCLIQAPQQQGQLTIPTNQSRKHPCLLRQPALIVADSSCGNPLHPWRPDFV